MVELNWETMLRWEKENNEKSHKDHLYLVFMEPLMKKARSKVLLLGFCFHTIKHHISGEESFLDMLFFGYYEAEKIWFWIVLYLLPGI